MPFLASLIEKGYSAKLRSTAHPLTPPAWTSVVTGRTPGHHGIYDFVRYEDMGDDIFFTLYDARDIRVETLWQIAGRQDRSVVSLNFPMMAPPPAINGSLVPGFVSWKHLRRNMYPATLFDRIKAFEGFNPKELSWDFERESQIGDVMPDEELFEWVDRHLPRDKQWFTMGLRLLQEDQPDLFALMMDGTDKIQHQAWHVLDPKLWTGSSETATLAVRKLVLQYFRNVDGYLKSLHEAAPDAHMIIVSDHGFTGSDKVVRINLYLDQLGHLAWRPSDGSAAAERRDLANFANLDWSRTRAFCPTPSSNGIVIRRRTDKCREGVSDDEYEDFRDKLITDLLNMTDAKTGQKVITQVMKREDIFPGAAMDKAPDLTLVLCDHGFVSVRNREPAVVTRVVPLGTHHPDGIFIMTGPGVSKTDGGTLSIVDTTAIVTHSLGLPVPRDFEGHVPDGLYDPAWLVAHPVLIGAPTQSVSGEASVTQDAPANTAKSAEDEQREEVLAQLRLLGYIED
jgi:predicted AlkP superfamily phosphohydrolase/phosphomutase